MENNILSNEKILELAKQNTHLYYRTLKAYYPTTYNFINEQYTGQNISEKIYKHIYGEKFCLKCNKLLRGRGFKGLLKGYAKFCSDICAFNHPYRLQRIIDANLKKYGVKWNGQIEVVKNKIKKNIFKKYGVLHISQVPAVHYKQTIGRFKVKLYTFPSGKQIKCQGYEPLALDILNKEINEDDIITSKKNMPSFWYITPDKKQHRYFPDIIIKSKRLVIEVKCPYTIKIDKNIHFKKQSVVDNGYEYKLMIFNGKKELINE